jgi:O-antigen/teichoic acid export membrane protein/O-antigen ligase
MGDPRRSLRGRWLTARNRSLGGSLVATGSVQVLLIVSGVLVARTLGPEDRGYFALLVVVSGICVLVGSLGIPTAVTYYVARNRGHAGAIVRALAAPAVIQVGATAVVQLGVLFALIRHDPQRVKVAATVSLLLVPGILSHSYGLAVLQGQERFRSFNIVRVLPTVTYVVAVVAVVVSGVANLVVLMTMWALSLFLGGLIALGVALRGLRSVGDVGNAPSRGKLVKFGAKSLVGSVSPIEALRLDQALVGLLLNPVALGFYVVAQAFTNVPRVIGMTVGMVAYPHVASQSSVAMARRTLWRYFFLGVGLSALAIGGLELLTGRLVVLFFGAEFQSATSIARVLLLATLFMVARRVLTDGLNGMGRPGLGTIGEIASWVFLLPTIALLLPRYGAVGVAVALAISWFASLVLLIVLVHSSTRRAPSVFPAVVQAARRVRSKITRALIVPTVGLVSAAAAGVGVALLPPLASIGLIVVLVGALSFAFGRTVLGAGFARGPHLERSAPARTLAVTSEESSEAFRLPRVLYYAGVLLLGIVTLRAGGQVTYSDTLFLFSFLLVCAALVVVRRRVPVGIPALLLLGICIFSLGGLVSTFEAYEPIKSGAVVLRLIFLTVFWFWLGIVVLDRRERVRRATGLWVLSAAITGAAALLQLAAGDVIPNTDLVFGRSTGFTNHPNDLGGITAVALVPALMLATRLGLSPLRRVGAFVVVLLVSGGLIASGSVGALLAAGVAALVWFALERMSFHSWLLLAGAVLCIVAIVSVQHSRGAPTPLDRVVRVTTPSDAATAEAGSGSVESRVSIYRVAASRIADDPFVGVGLDLVSITKPFGIVSYQYDVHNLVIGTWYKAGLFGLAGILIALFAVFRAGRLALVASGSADEHREAAALTSAVVAFVVFSMSEPIIYSRFGWIAPALLLALRAVQERQGQPVVVFSARESPVGTSVVGSRL